MPKGPTAAGRVMAMSDLDPSDDPECNCHAPVVETSIMNDEVVRYCGKCGGRLS